MPNVKYRYYTDGLNPRRTRLETPGWGGDREPRKSGSTEQPWHCLPFTESARYGIELFYPFDVEFRASKRNGELILDDSDFGPPPENYGGEWPPFRRFGTPYYTYQVSIDLKPEEGYALRFEPHPRVFTDMTDTAPVAVPALIRRWWPMTYFLVFKAPPEGCTHIFRPGEPMAQVLVLPEEADFELVPMPPEEAAEREMQSRRIYQSRATLGADSTWTSATNTVFDGTYRRILGAASEKARSEKARKEKAPTRDSGEGA